MKNTLNKNQCLVLIVDDKECYRQEMRIELEEEGYQVVEAKNGTEAINAFQKLQPDLVMIDTVLPCMNGFECCHKLLSIDSNKYTPVFMVTDIEDQDSINYAFEVGAADYCVKPINWPILRQRIKCSIEQSQLQEKLVADNQKLQHLVNFDCLTQVANRRYFDEYLSCEWQSHIREQQPISFILCDVDYFKSYNDTYGHLFGDRCLHAIAQAIKSVIKRPTDLVARYGGDEFAVILPRTNLEGVAYLSEIICSAVKSLAIPNQKSQVSSHVTMSAGFSTIIPQLASSFEDIIVAADLLMYEAKVVRRACCLSM